MAAVAERAGILHKSLYRLLSTEGNPTVNTLLAVLDATSLKLCVHRAAEAN